MGDHTQQTDYTFSWTDLGDIEVGRPNLGNSASVLAYRLLQYTFKDVLTKTLGRKETAAIFVRARPVAGPHFCRQVLDTSNLDVLARWGGEEFVVLLPGSALEPAMQAAEKLRGLIEVHPFPGNETITCSFGVSQYREGDTPEKITARADDALYAAKAAGRNLVRAETA